MVHRGTKGCTVFTSRSDFAEDSGEVSLSDLFPDVSNEELREAEDRFARYAALVVRMETRLKTEPGGELPLTKAVGCDTKE